MKGEYKHIHIRKNALTHTYRDKIIKEDKREREDQEKLKESNNRFFIFFYKKT